MEDDCSDVITRGWCTLDASMRLSDHISQCKLDLMAWAGDRFRCLPRQIKQKMDLLNSLKTHDMLQVSTIDIQWLEKEVELLSSKEEIYWKQRSRANWLAYGDRNSKYFHACASRRRARNLISGLVSSHGDWCTDKSSMAEIVLDYFSNLFMSTNPSDQVTSQAIEHIVPKVNADMNATLCAQFSAEEVRKALFDMHPNKAPGPDGMSTFFFQKYWHEIGREVSLAVLEILNGGRQFADWNETIVTLISKIKNPMTMKDFRPISLCNVCYKIVARAPKNRLRPLMNKVVDEFQRFEALHWIRSRKKGFAALKLDMSKAYDRIEWIFLEQIMLKLGFAQAWVEKMMWCVRSVKYSFALNGEIIGSLHPSRGLRQDDSHVFFKATIEECDGIRQCLSLYEKASGQLINFEKSSLSFSLIQMSKKLQFRYLIERVVTRLQGWGHKPFSAGGKETLIKSVLQSIPTYAMSCFHLPKAIGEAIERECANLWWGMQEGKKKMHWKTWQSLYVTKCMGGMGFRHLESFNKALLAKQLWRIISDPESLVARVLKARYFKHQDIMHASLRTNPSYTWRSLLWSRNLLNEGLRWRSAHESLNSGNKRNMIIPLARWMRPQLDQQRLEVDAAVNEATGNYSIDGIVRDHAGHLLIAFGGKISKPLSVVHGELVAIQEGLRNQEEVVSEDNEQGGDRESQVDVDVKVKLRESGRGDVFGGCNGQLEWGKCGQVVKMSGEHARARVWRADVRERKSEVNVDKESSNGKRK
ncbi:uncharacterized protein [Primulina eburnea]|uniref:uncharacterized protein n=1 Tax=Primulina eburnea TaxID=1245227 RepID=UPI003C6C8325